MYDMIAKELMGKKVSVLLNGQFSQTGTVLEADGKILKLAVGKKQKLIYINFEHVVYIEPAE